MAVARPQPGPGFTGVHIALIVFVVVTIASLVFTIIMYTQQEDLRARADQAVSRAASANQQADDAKKQYQALAKLLLGAPDAEPAQIEQETNNIRRRLGELERLPEAQRRQFQQYALVTAFDELAKQYAQLSADTAKLEADLAAANADRQRLQQDIQAKEAQFAAQADQLRTAYDDLKAEYDKNFQTWSANAEKFGEELAHEKDLATQNLNKAHADVTRLQTELAKAQQRVDELNAALEQYRPSHDARAVLREPDGRVLRVLPDASVAYINLGKRDRVTPGLTFSVFSPVGGISDEGKGKATLEVVNVMHDTSECRITSVVPGDIVVEGDYITNPVYDKNRTFNFAVAGEFDLNFDGKIEDPQGVQVKKLIRGWGGRIVDTVDEQTDFVVLGTAPTEPKKPTGFGVEEDEEAQRVRREAYEKRLAAYEKIKLEARALGIPILTRTQFLHFVGYYVPSNVRPDPAI